MNALFAQSNLASQASTSSAQIDVKTISQFSNLKREAALLYGDTQSLDAQEFLRVNQLVFGLEGKVQPGMVVFIPAGVSRADEEQMIAMLRRLNRRIAAEFTLDTRQILAEQANTLDNILSDPQLSQRARATFTGLAGATNSLAGGVFNGFSQQNKVMSLMLKELEARYKFTIQTQGKLTPDFYRYRTQLYRNLDTTGGRMARVLSGLSPYKQNAKARLKISTKSLTLHWKRNNFNGGIEGFEPHYINMGRAAQLWKVAGGVSLAIDGALMVKDVHGICSDPNTTATQCKHAGIIEGAGFAGGALGGAAGGFGGYMACNAVFGAPSAGSSLLWCGLIVGGAGSIAGGAAFKALAQTQTRKALGASK